MAFSVRSLLISESVDASCKKILEENGIKVVEKKNMTKDELLVEIKDYDGLIIRSGTKVTADVINAAKNLKIIGRAGTGVDNVDIDTSTRNGIIVMNTPNGNTISAAELTCGMIMCLARKIPQGAASMRAGNWDRKKFMGMELYGKILGIVGLGRIGKEVATRMQSFGMKTIGYDPIIPAEVATTFGVEFVSLEHLWPRSDFITVHTPLMPSTEGLLNDETFAKCKKGVKVINCARGGIIDEEALLRALESGQCGGAGLDVFVEEPPKNLCLVNHPNVIACPHLGASTYEAQERCGKDIAAQIVDMVKGSSLVGAINAQALSRAVIPETKPWIQLGEALGMVAKAFAGQVNGQTKVQVATAGMSLRNTEHCVATAVTLGLLKGDLENHVNLINASLLAKEAGLTVVTKHDDAVPGDLTNVCALEITTSSASHKFLGSIQVGIPVLLEVDGAAFKQAVPLSGNLLIYKAMEYPQVLQSVAGVLASAGIQIESYNVTTAMEGDQWCIMKTTSLLVDLNLLEPYIKLSIQLTI
ncbi:D-3-phosphoglycerate dehydrogenase [Pristis pectinata]|uniref:D-3-phosphoglycerate dehydrogenase n=1 Tax=Pristis pectinata TaxID=685728 RepID=UPI00223DE918|nr:D-3-phosphoglycerate dehydrogenase [Pristis pectinata]